MASNKTLLHRVSKITNHNFKNFTICRTGFPPPGRNKPDFAPDPGDAAIFRRFLHRGAGFHPPTSPDFRPLAFGSENVMEKLGSFGNGFSRNRIILDGLSPPVKIIPEIVNGLTIEDARKLVRLAAVVKVKSRLKEIPKRWITYQEFIGLCGEGGLDRDDGVELAKTLDETGAVIVLGNVVFLKPEQIVKAIASLIPTPETNTRDPRSKELEEMEKQKTEIDRKAAELVRRELQWGLGFLVAQTAALMRLTFWELSWDVMEPICYYVTTTYFMAGYAFFLTTSKEPCFEGLYRSRFDAKQKRLMKLCSFDIDRYNQLRKSLDQNKHFGEVI